MNHTPIMPGDFITLPDASPDWWRYVVGFGPDGRLITVDCHNKVERFSDPTEHWVLLDPPPFVDWFRNVRSFSYKDSWSGELP